MKQEEGRVLTSPPPSQETNKTPLLGNENPSTATRPYPASSSSFMNGGRSMSQRMTLLNGLKLLVPDECCGSDIKIFTVSLHLAHLIVALDTLTLLHMHRCNAFENRKRRINKCKEEE